MPPFPLGIVHYLFLSVNVYTHYSYDQGYKNVYEYLYLTLCNPMDCSLPGSSVYGILQARTLERVAISFSSARETKNRSFHFLTKGS